MGPTDPIARDSAVLVTGSSGHLGEALVTAMRAAGRPVVGLDRIPGPTTDVVGSVADGAAVARALRGASAVVHAATLHKPHLGTHDRRSFVETNVIGTLTLLEAAADAGVGAFVFTSSTSAYGRALDPPQGSPAGWITEEVVPLPRNIYGVTKIAAEDVCELVARERGLPTVVLRLSRFFPERDDVERRRDGYADANLKVNELLHRRVDVADVVTAVECAIDRAGSIGFDRFVVSATTPFSEPECPELGRDAPAVVARHFPEQPSVYATLGWSMFPTIDRVYVNARARDILGWVPRHDFTWALGRVAEGLDPRSDLARSIGAKGYHDRSTGVYTTR